MIVAAESNFVLQLALKQEQGAAARSILELAEGRRIELAIPACALFEPYETIVRRHRKRELLMQEFRREIDELARSTAFSDLGSTSKAVTSTVAESVALEAADLDRAIDRIAVAATIIPLTGDIVTTATIVRQSIFDLTAPDAIVFASIDAYFKSQRDGTKVFATTNAKDFLRPKIRDYVATYDCRVIPSLNDALAHIQHELAAE
jgi:hypothetical protein